MGYKKVLQSTRAHELHKQKITLIETKVPSMDLESMVGGQLKVLDLRYQTRVINALSKSIIRKGKAH